MDNINNQIFKLLNSTPEKSFELIYRHYYNGLCKYAIRYLDNMSEAEDIVQTTIIKLWNNIEQLNKIDNIENYLYRCVKNACLNFLRNNKSRINHISEIDIALLEIANEQINDTDEKYEQIEKAIEALPLQCKQILELNRFEGLSYKEIATKLNISHRTVDSHLCNAMKQIRKKLNPTLTCSIIFLISMLKQL